MFALKRGWCVALAVLGLVVLPGRCLAQATDAEKAKQEAQLKLAEAQLRVLYRLSLVASNRLGATVESPSAAVANQLDLPAGQGQVIKNVRADSAAAKAGIQANDILLEVDGKPVSSDMGEFEKTLASLKPETAVDAVVLRKGQKTAIKGLTMPKVEQPAQFNRAELVQAQPAVPAEFARLAMPQIPGQVLPAEVQGQLRLTPEQKEKLAKLQKDTEAQLMELLTDEQKKQLEILKKRSQPNPQPQPRQREEEIRKQLDDVLKKQQEQREQARKQAEQAQKEAELALQKLTFVIGRGSNRLGATLESPSDAVATQLNLPQGQGIVIRNVPANSAAAKAGLQPNDILLELGGKSISRIPADFDKAVEQIKPETPVDAVVLRKGEKMTVKGVALVDASQATTRVRAMNPAPKVPGDILPTELQGQLKLTAEQKEKLAKLQKETEAKLMELLTEEQKKQLEQLKKNQAPIQLRLLIDDLQLQIEKGTEKPKEPAPQKR
jgi:C-terminal processing protease CtpA/Prc